MEGSQIWESALISDTPDDASIELKKPVRAWRPRDKAPLLKISVSLLNTYLGINEVNSLVAVACVVRLKNITRNTTNPKNRRRRRQTNARAVMIRILITSST